MDRCNLRFDGPLPSQNTCQSGFCCWVQVSLTGVRCRLKQTRLYIFLSELGKDGNSVAGWRYRVRASSPEVFLWSNEHLLFDKAPCLSAGFLLCVVEPSTLLPERKESVSSAERGSHSTRPRVARKVELNALGCPSWNVTIKGLGCACTRGGVLAKLHASSKKWQACCVLSCEIFRALFFFSTSSCHIKLMTSICTERLGLGGRCELA